jgi:hypothetical protein
MREGPGLKPLLQVGNFPRPEGRGFLRRSASRNPRLERGGSGIAGEGRASGAQAQVV